MTTTAGSDDTGSHAGSSAAATGPSVVGQTLADPSVMVDAGEASQAQAPLSDSRDALALADEECPSRNNNPTPGDPVPGAWWNPSRWGTGWTFAFDSTHQKMMVVWHTFYPRNGGGQTWLHSDFGTVSDGGGGMRHWSAGLYSTRYGVFGGTRVGTVTLDFFGDSATRAKVQWSWNEPSENIHNLSGNECLYAFFQDGPPQAPSLIQPQPPEVVSAGANGPYYTGIWSDFDTTPGFVMEVAQGQNGAGYTELDTLSIYDTDDKPLWLWSQFGPMSAWPVSAWTTNNLGYRTATYNIATDDCSQPAGCIQETIFSQPAHYYGRQFHSVDLGVQAMRVRLTATSTTPGIDWPKTDWPAVPPDADLSGCRNSIPPPNGPPDCRPIKRQTDRESLQVWPTICDVLTPGGTCQIDVGWTESVLGVVQRLDPDTQQPVPHFNAQGVSDEGIVGGGIYGEVQDTLAADERVLYRLKNGTRTVTDIGARAGYSWVTASSPCVIPPNSTQCQTTVSWWTPDPATNNFIYVYRYVSTGGAPAVRNPAGAWVSQQSSGTKVDDNVQSGTTVYYEVWRQSGTNKWLASTSSNPTVPVNASIVAKTADPASPNVCSVPIGQSSCPISITWLANSPSALVQRVDYGSAPAVTVGQGYSNPANTPVVDNLPRGSHVKYAVSIGGVEQTHSGDITAITSTLWTEESGCVVVTGQSTCPIHVRWSSTNSAQVTRVDEIGGTVTPVGSGPSDGAGPPDQLPAGSRVHYELKIGGIQHAVTPAVTASTDSEGGDSNDGPAEPIPPIAGFSEPSLDLASDQVGAIAGEFHVDQGGGAVYRIPLAVPPGAGGLAPSLAITYGSSNGDGVLGTGFTMDGISAITPCRSSIEAGDSGGPTADPNQFCLDGQRLLLVSGTHRQAGAEYRTEIDTFQRIKLTAVESPVVSSAPRQAFVFTVEGKDGSLRTFGGSAGTVFGLVSSDASPPTVQAQGWMQTQLKDVSSNTIGFQYTAVATLGERYLQGVTYTGGSVSFTYGASPRIEVANSTLGQRRQSQLLTSIDIKDAGGGALRHYEPTYDTTSSPMVEYRPHVIALRECNRAGGACYPATTFEWSQASPQITEVGGQMGRGIGYYQFGDFNGDKRSDLWWTSENNERLHISTFSAPAPGQAPTLHEIFTNDRLLPDGYNNGGLWEVFDSNNDGKDDLLFVFNSLNGAESDTPNQMGWIRRLSTGTGLGEEQTLFSVPISWSRCLLLSQELASRAPQQPAGTLSLLGSSMLADVDGDGLPDIVFRACDGQFWVALTKLTGNTSEPYTYTPLKITFLNQDGSLGGDDRCGFATSSLARKEENFSQATDFDGDGRADLRFVIDARDCPSLGGQFRLDVFVSKGIRGKDGTFAFQAYSPFGDNITVTADGIAEAGLELRTLDVNGDGLTDLVYRKSDNFWHLRLGGPNSKNSDVCIAGCTLQSDRAPMQLIDLDGDGKLDFWERYTTQQGDFYRVHLWKGSDWAVDSVETGYHIPGNDWTRIAADFDGDGIADNFFAKSSEGDWYLQRSLAHHDPRGVVTAITNGLGATTEITYAPLTYSNVYRRDYDGPFLLSGRGSPVFDVASSSYVVHEVASSAPIATHPDQMSAVTYRYAGLKVQGGGRGSLGFRRVSTFDEQSGVEIDSHYSQRFPYTGLTEFTETRQLSATKATDPCGDADAASCMVYVAPCASGPSTTCDGDLPQITDRSKTIKESVDQWQWRMGSALGNLVPVCSIGAPTCSSPEELDRQALQAAHAPIFLARIESLTSNYDPALGEPGTALTSESLEFPMAGYDANGNPGTSTTSKTGGGTTVSTTSAFHYADVVDLTHWKLGRLTSAAVKTTRTADGSTTSNIRQSSFTYDANGLLASERVEGMTGTFPNGLGVDTLAPAAAKYYAYDGFGNKTKTSVCSTTIPEATCRAQAAPTSSGYQFHPSTPANPATPPDVMRYTRVGYDYTGRYADSISEVFATASSSQELAPTMIVGRNAAGDPLEIDQIDLGRTKVRYGALGRKRFTWAPTGETTQWDASYCSGPNSQPGTSTPCPVGMGLAYVSITRKSGAATAATFYDVLGRPTISMTQGFSGAWMSSITQYDDSGNVQRQSDPFPAQNNGTGAATPASGYSLTWTETTYDALNRPTKVRHTGSLATTTIAYSGLKTTTTMPMNGSGFTQTAIEVKNGLGEVVKTIDPNGFEVTTAYDAGGNPTTVNRGGLASTTNRYDSLGRKIGTTDPDAGNWTYQVDGVGDVVRQYSTKTCTTSDYDGRGRVWRRRDYANGGCTTLETEATWTYDTVSPGHLSQETNGQVMRTSQYDGFGRLVRLDTSEEGKSYTEQWNFDQFGRPFQHFFVAPGLPTTGERNVYTSAGYLSQVRSAFPLRDGTYPVYREIQEVNARGQVTHERTAAQAEYTLDREFDVNTGRLKRLLAQSSQPTSAGILQDVSYTYDLVGNVMTRTGHDTALGLVESFTYDNLQRLVSSKVMSAGQITFTRSQSYDGQGNILGKSDVNGAYNYGTRPNACLANSPPGPHAVSAIGANMFALCYDANGNVVKQVDALNRTKTLQYTAADQVKDIRDDIDGTRVGFAYGPNRERVRRLDYVNPTASADSVVHTVGSAEMRYSATTSSTANQLQEVRRYIGNVLVVQTGSGGTYRLKRQILLTDAQGSTHQVLGAMTLAPTNASIPASFDSWGLRRDGATWGGPTPWTANLETMLRQTTTHGYTGHEMAESVGIIHMNGRIYDPLLGRFLQADPFVQSPGNGQSWNRFSYGFNNPMAFTDPTGYSSVGDYLRIAAAIVITVYTGGAAAGVISAAGGMSAAVASGAIWNAAAWTVVGGFAAGAVQSGTLKGAVIGAVSAGAFFGVGTAFSQGVGASWMFNGDRLSFAGYAAKTLSHGLVGGVMAELQGGRFGHGFASAGFSEALSPAVGGIRSTPAQAIAVAVAGGTASTLAGGKFGNGAVTAAFSYAFNEMAHRQFTKDDIQVRGDSSKWSDGALDTLKGNIVNDENVVRDMINKSGDEELAARYEKVTIGIDLDDWKIKYRGSNAEYGFAITTYESQSIEFNADRYNSLDTMKLRMDRIMHEYRHLMDENGSMHSSLDWAHHPAEIDARSFSERFMKSYWSLDYVNPKK